MISRHSVRVKVMQTVYAYERSEEALPNTFKKQLEKSIYSSDTIYIYLLYFIRELVDEVDKISGIKATKFLPSEDDKNFSVKILSNPFMQLLNTDERFQKLLKSTGLSQNLQDNPIINALCKKMIDFEFYKTYVNQNQEELLSEKAVIEKIIDEVILKDDLFTDHIEEIFPSWEDDSSFVIEEVKTLIRKSNSELKLYILKASTKNKMTELADFGAKLFEKMIYLKDIHTEEIEPYLKNWELERIAVIDLIIIRLGLTEFAEFPSIPIKVTMNECIELTKKYSSPKSKDFVNGVLDRMMKDMVKTNRIAKTGRGLN